MQNPSVIDLFILWLCRAEIKQTSRLKRDGERLMVNPRVDVPRDATVAARPASQILPESGAKNSLKAFFLCMLLKMCLHHSDKHKMSAKRPPCDYAPFGE